MLLVLRFPETESVGLTLPMMGSMAGMPTSVSKSARIADFKRTSKGVSQPSEGDRFTSRSHGFSSWSMRISNPYNSTTTKTQLTNYLIHNTRIEEVIKNVFIFNQNF